MHEVVVFSHNPGVLSLGAELFGRNTVQVNLDVQFFNSLAGSLLHLPGATLCATPPLGGEL
jgi:hypothetical protein